LIPCWIESGKTDNLLYVAYPPLDSDGNAYVTGITESDESSFPVTVGPDLTFNGGIDGFIAKVNSLGTELLYCGYIGGIEDDSSVDIALDNGGNAYVTGYTHSDESSFPVAIGPDLTLNGDDDAFVAKLDCLGTAILYCGYIGGEGDDFGFGIAVDIDGNAYVTGRTNSDESSFPVTIGPDLTYNEVMYIYGDAFIAKVNASGTVLSYCGYIGGSFWDSSFAIAVDTKGNAYIAGGTFSKELTFPVKMVPEMLPRRR